MVLEESPIFKNRPVVDTGGMTLLKESVAKAVGLKPDMLKASQYASVFGGVTVGVHTYSFRDRPLRSLFRITLQLRRRHTRPGLGI